ncbi:2OG-Fe dioxygenase family protein [Franzmannia qiaohouensis]|uniref:2OG-Fe dioxygenase family protein n=1 Tax=Franzmannia qiaohouensis TaxID=1329370 RepID=A0ABU1HGU1_9GAMM|nr:2OG-Fe dioxygenase family protein [Halomonas qiaohouensis]MDR5906697.1 2OG-Fe dioxygenase family protein [Halomonas qiaohouensis]
MKQESLKHGYDVTSMPFDFARSYWQPEVHSELAEQHWSVTDVRAQIDLPAWQGYLADLPRDPYVNQRWKRMDWLMLNDRDEVEVMGDCPMAQGGMFNDADSMADVLRYYPNLEKSFVERSDVKAFVKAWAKLWGIGAREPILMQITGMRGSEPLDPLQGQGIHSDGCKYLSIMVLSRDNVSGANSLLFADKAGTQPLTKQVLTPGDVLHIRDDKLFHGADGMTQDDRDKPYERFIIIINSRFVDAFQNKMLRRHFPDAVLNEGH